MSTVSFPDKRERLICYTHQWVVGVTGRNREADERVGFILVILSLFVSGFRVTSFSEADMKRSYDEPRERLQGPDLLQCHAPTCCRFGCLEFR